MRPTAIAMTFKNQGEAEEVRDAIQTIITRYEYATVADLYELTGSRSDYELSRIGWTDINYWTIQSAPRGIALCTTIPELIVKLLLKEK